MFQLECICFGEVLGPVLLVEQGLLSNRNSVSEYADCC